MSWESVIPNVFVRDAHLDASRAAVPPMDDEAFAGFYERSARSLWAYLARTSGDPALAEDLMQESYVRFLCATLREEGEVAARRYLFRIATNLLRDHWRRPRTTPIEDVPENFELVRFLCATLREEGEVAARRYLFRIATNLLRDHWRRPRTTPIEDVPENF